MRESIQPKYEKLFEVVRAKPLVKFSKKRACCEICSKCIRFLRETKLVDTGGRVEKFKKKYGIEEEE